MDFHAKEEVSVRHADLGVRCKRLTELSARFGHGPGRLLPHRFGRHEWVLTFPHQVRSWLLWSPELFNEVISVVVDSISFHYEQHAVLVFGQEHIKLPTSGSVSFVQFFGSSLAPNPHLHMMFLDGVFASGKDGVKFFEHRGLSQALGKIKNKIIALRTSCLLTYSDKMSFYPACTRKLTKNIVTFIVTFA